MVNDDLYQNGDDKVRNRYARCKDQRPDNSGRVGFEKIRIKDNSENLAKFVQMNLILLFLMKS